MELKKLLMLFVPLLFVFSNPSLSEPEEVEIRILHRSMQCGLHNPEFSQLQNIHEVHNLKPRSLTLSKNKATAPPISPFDKKREHVVLVSLGRKNSAGYGLKLLSRIALIENNTLTLPLKMQTPRNRLSAQVITSPCMVLAFNKGNYSTVEWRDDTLQLSPLQLSPLQSPSQH